jgi:hypothetical protein
MDQIQAQHHVKGICDFIFKNVSMQEVKISGPQLSGRSRGQSDTALAHVQTGAL